jgi:hypothetical protein
MKKIITMLALLFCIQASYGQLITSLKIKTTANTNTRNALLDEIKRGAKKYTKEELLLTVSVLNTYKNYAWAMVIAERKDGLPLTIADNNNGPYDCCHIEVLFKKQGNKWAVVESGYFATDIWWGNIWERTKLPKDLFTSNNF